MKTNLIFFALILLAACGTGYDSEPSVGNLDLNYEDASGDINFYALENERDASEAIVAPVNYQPAEPQKPAPTIDRKIIRNASLHFQVADFDSSSNALEAAVKRYDAYIVESERTGRHRQLGGIMTIRVKGEQLDPLLADLLEQSIYLDRKNVSSNDVTEEFVDLEIRLQNKREVEKKYLEILTKAKTIKEILEVEDKIGVIREEIEAKEGRLKFLKNQVAYSTIHLNYYQENWISAKSPGFTFWQRIGDGLSGGWDLLLGFVVGLTYGWPFILILLAIIFWVRWYFKKRTVA